MADDEVVPEDLLIIQGTDQEWAFRRVNNETSEPFVPTSAWMQIRSRVGGDVWVEFALITSLPVGGAFPAAPSLYIEAVTGWVYIYLPHGTTETVDWASRKRGVWDLEVQFDGRRKRWWAGEVTVSSDVTRVA